MLQYCPTDGVHLIDRVAKEELAKGKSVEDFPQHAESVGTVPKVSEPPHGGPNNFEEESGGENRIKELELKLRDSEITNRAKDMHIKRQNEERELFFEQLIEASRQIGALETKLLQLEGPKQERPALDGEEDVVGTKENTVSEAGAEDAEGSQHVDTSKEAKRDPIP